MTGTTDGLWTVTPRSITVTALGGSSIYGDGGTNPGLSASNLASGETVSVLTGLSNSFGIGPTSAAGNYTLNVAGTLTNGNYTVTGTTDGLWTVTPRSITVSANDLARIYGDANPALTFGTVIGGGGLASFDADLAAAGYGLATIATATSNVGSYDIALTGTNANYAMTFTPGTLKVNQRAITVSANDLARIYGNANPALTWTVGGSGLVNGDALAGALATTATATSNAGDYAILQGSLGASANYAMTFDPGMLTVNQRALTVTADASGKVYGEADPALTWSITNGWLASFDTIGGVFSGAPMRGAGEMVGDYTISQGSLVTNANYAMAFVPGRFTIAPTQYTQSQVLERQGDDDTLLLSNASDGDTTHACSDGVLGPDCALYVNAGNRHLGPYIGMTE